MSDINTRLEQAREDFEKKKAELEREFKAQKEKLEIAAKVKSDLADALTKAVKIADDAPASERNTILSDSDIAKLVRNLCATKLKATTAGTRVKRTDEEYISFLSDWRSPAELCKHFEPLTAAGASGVLKRLVAAKKVTRRANPEKKGFFQFKAA